MIIESVVYTTSKRGKQKIGILFDDIAIIGQDGNIAEGVYNYMRIVGVRIDVKLILTTLAKAKYIIR